MLPALTILGEGTHHGTTGPLDNAGPLASYATDRDGQAVRDQATLHLTVGGRVSACPIRAVMPVAGR
jgi:hypothetical protein